MVEIWLRKTDSSDSVGKVVCRQVFMSIVKAVAMVVVKHEVVACGLGGR